MSKKITSFLVLLAVMLLTLPSQAQNQLRSRVDKNATEIRGSKKILNATDLAKAKESVAKASEVQLADANIGNWNWAAHETAPFVPGQTEYALRGFELKRKPVSFLNAFDGKPVNRAATTDAHGIITSPDEGEHKYYTRAGSAYYASGQSVYLTAQSGIVEIVELEDGTVYIKDIVSRYSQGTWVKGTKEGNTITVEAGQPVGFNTQYMTTLSVNWGSYDEADGFGEKEAGDIVFTIDGDVITLEGSNEYHFVGVYWDDDETFSGSADFETVWTLDPTYEPPTTDLVELPEGAEVATWYNQGYTLSSSGASKYKNQNAKVAFVGNDVYVSGIFTNFPTSWIKGTLSGTTVTFEGLQYIGDYQGLNIFALGATEDAVIENFTMTYDAEANTLAAQNLLFANAATDRVYYLEGYQEMLLSLDPPAEPTATTGPNVDTLPYSQSLTTADSFADFGVLDANEDGKTWTLAAGMGAQYTYNSAAAADDWLITPAIKLEAGKPYHFAIDAATYSASYPEKFEVKMATAAKASVLSEGTEIIPVTTVVSSAKEFYTFENESFVVEETGYYHFGVHAVSPANMWTLYVANVLVEEGPDPTAPAAVEAFTVTPLDGELGAVISFTAPTKAINGETLAANAITKIDILRDGAVINTIEAPATGAELTYTDQAEDLTIGTHKYQAIAYGETGIGGKSEAVEVFLFAILNVPASFDLTKQDVFTTFQVVDANADGKTWSWDASYGTYYNYSSSLAANDYLISVGINLKKGNIYKVAMDARSYSDNYPEKFEVLVGTEATVEAMTLTAIPVTTVASATDVEFEGEFIAPEDGVYYLAVHAVSDANMWRLHVSKLAIEKGPEPTAPAAPELTMTPADLGELEATGEVKVPATAINGEPLTDNISVDIYRDDELFTTFNMAPGSSKQFVDVTCEGGLHTYMAVPSNASGVGQKSEKVTIFVGPDVPAPIENIAVSSPEAGKLTFTWDPAVGANGGYVDPTKVEYTVVTLVEEVVLFWTVLVEDQTLGSVTGKTTATVDFDVDLGEAGFQYFGVKATVNGETSDPTVNYGYARTGAPVQLPIIETFEGKQMNNVWFTSNASLYVSEDSSDGDGVSLALTPTLPQPTEFMTLKLDLKQAANPTILFDAKKGTSAADKIEVFALTPDGVYTVLETVTLTDEYQSFKIVVPSALKNVRWAHLGFKVNFEDAGNVLLDNIKILDFYQYDLSVAVSAPASVVAGNKAAIKVVVKNEGENAATGYTVKLNAGDEELLNTPVNETLQSFATAEFTAELETSIFDDAADVALIATVEYVNDLNPDNDVASALVTIKEPSAVGVTDVTAEYADGSILVGWTAPENVTEETTEDVEAYADFEVGGLNEDVHVGNIGEWTVYDGNGVFGYGFNGITVPGLGDHNAWLVMNPASPQISQDLSANYPAHSGTKFFISTCVAEPETNIPDTDHWLISPELPGVAQTLSFFARTITDQYGPETFEILVSSTDAEIESFTVLATETTEVTDWTEFTYELPAGTKYFAIRHTSNDVFGLLVDDITFSVGGGEIDHFNIYLDNELNTTAAADEATATIENVGTGSHTVAVSVVYTGGQESKPVVVNVDVATGLNSITVITKPVDVYSLDGKLVRKQTTSFDGLKGVYVVDGKKVVLK